jgi:hypothetical protein
MPDSETLGHFFGRPPLQMFDLADRIRERDGTRFAFLEYSPSADQIDREPGSDSRILRIEDRDETVRAVDYYAIDKQQYRSAASSSTTLDRVNGMLTSHLMLSG